MDTRRSLIPSLIIAWLLAGAADSVTGGPETQGVTNRMDGIFRALQTVFFLSLDPEGFQAPRNRGMILDDLDAITADAAQLAAHEQGSEGFAVLSRSLADDAGRALSLFADGDMSGARFQINSLVSRCFACHSRLPGADSEELGKAFMEDPRVLALPLREQMTVAVASRRFTLALDLGERILGSEDVPAAAIDMTGVIEDYLKIAVRVQSDFARPIAALEAFRTRTDVPSYLRTYLDVWLQSLQSLEVNPASGDDGLAMARTLIQHGRIRNLYPADRRGLVYFLVASGLLHQFVELTPQDPERTAEAFYHLGVIDETISSSLWPSETELYLEKAIRLDPRTPLARQAFGFLEEYLLSGYTGSAGMAVPPGVAAHLDTLRALAGGE
jgi:hypothetical protein